MGEEKKPTRNILSSLRCYLLTYFLLIWGCVENQTFSDMYFLNKCSKIFFSDEKDPSSELKSIFSDPEEILFPPGMWSMGKLQACFNLE